MSARLTRTDRPERAVGDVDEDARRPKRPARSSATTSPSAVNDRVAALRGSTSGERRRSRACALSRRAPLALEREERRALQPVARRDEPLAVALGGAPRAAVERGAGALEPLAQLGDVGHDEPRGGGRGRGAHVGGEIAERRVLLVADGRDDRHRRSSRRHARRARPRTGADPRSCRRRARGRSRRRRARTAPSARRRSPAARAGPGRTSRRPRRWPAGSGS